MKKKFICLVFMFAAIIPSFAQKKITLKIATVAVARTPWDIKLRELAQEWNRITNGEVSLKFYNVVTLGGEKAGILKMKPPRPGQKPQMDGAVLSPIGLNEIAPKARIFTFSTPFLIQNQKELDIVLEKYGKTFEEEIQKAGYKLLTWSNVGWLSFYTKDSYSTLKELKGIKTACLNDTKDFADILKVSGFNVLTVDPAKFSQEIQSPTGAKSFTSISLLAFSAGYYKDASYILDARIAPIMAGFVMNESSWASVPDKYKPQMLAALEKTRRELNEALEDMEEDYINKMKDAGLKMIYLDKSQHEAWRNEFHEDMVRVNKTLPTVINMDLYEKITKLLEKYRK